MEGERFALEGEDSGDVDEALREAVEAVERVLHDGAEPPEHETTELGVSGTEEIGQVPGEVPTAGLREELSELRERSTRTLADFDNYRKRVDRERQDQQRYNGMEVLRGLLDIVDNLERALASEGPVEDLKTGVELTLRQTRELLRRHHVSLIEADGAAFDPTVHEAVARHEEEDVCEPIVRTVLQSGYKMHDRLLRPARVAVAVPGPRVSEPTDPPDQEG